METRAEIEQLAWERLSDAKALAAAHRYDCAYYIAGYAVELMLKARICGNMQLEDLFLEQQALTDPVFASGVRRISKTAKTHDLPMLVAMAGLYVPYTQTKNKKLIEAKPLLFVGWSESARYSAHPLKQDADVIRLLDIIEDPKDGVLQWIINA